MKVNGKLLERLRIDAGLERKQLVDLAKIGIKTLSSLESTADGSFSRETVIRYVKAIAEKRGVPDDEIFSMAGLEIPRLAKPGTYFPPQTIQSAPNDVLFSHEWRNHRFYELLRTVRRGEEKAEDDDLRIVTTQFIAVMELGLEELLDRGVRIKILMMNPKNRRLLEARFKIRSDGYDPKHAAEGIREQIERLKQMGCYVAGRSNGTLQVRVSDLMPSCFCVCTREWALVGLFLGQWAYVRGPMIEVQSGTKTWETLNADFEARWAAAAKNVVYST
jgi:hypothetical protein